MIETIYTVAGTMPSDSGLTESYISLEDCLFRSLPKRPADLVMHFIVGISFKVKKNEMLEIKNNGKSEFQLGNLR